MAYRPRYSNQNYGYGYNRNDYQSNGMNRNGPPMMRNCNGNIPMPRFPGPNPNMAGPYAGRPPPYPGSNDAMMRGPPPFRGRPPMPGSRMPPSGMGYPQSYADPGFYRDGPPRLRFPGGGGNERFFVPWNQRPKPFYGGNRGAQRNAPRPSNYAQNRTSQKQMDDKPKRKKNKKRKYTARAKEESKKLKPWMTDEIYEEVKKKNEMYVKCKNEDKPELWQEFRLLRNRVSSLIKDAKLKGGFITRKQKEDDQTERPFSCDTCDRAFVDENELETHVKEHVKCETDGCQFEAHPKVVELHKKVQHETGYAATIMKLNSDEEIQKWREERRSHYPTIENIKKRQAETQEKIARGEIVTEKEFGKFRKWRTKSHRGAAGVSWQRGRGKRFPLQWQRRGTKLRSGDEHHEAPPSKRQKFEPHNESESDDSDELPHIKLHEFKGMVSNTTGHSSSELSCTENECFPCNSSSGNLVVEQGPVSAAPRISILPGKLDTVADSQGVKQSENVSITSLESNLISDHLPVTNCERFEIPGGRQVDCPSFGVKSEAAEDAARETLESQGGNNTNNRSGNISDDEGPDVVAIGRKENGVHIEKSVSEKTEDEGPDVVAIGREENVVHVEQSVPEKTEEDKKIKGKPVFSNGEKHAAGGGHKNSGFKSNQSQNVLKNSLLEKLLAKEIRHERNVILQCVRYTVKNNFFRGED